MAQIMQPEIPQACSAVSNLTNISSNLQAGRGRVEDADFAAETTSLAKSQILQQASTAMLAQADASKQNVLSLLKVKRNAKAYRKARASELFSFLRVFHKPCQKHHENDS